jgi:hypothetical protein
MPMTEPMQQPTQPTPQAIPQTTPQPPVEITPDASRPSAAGNGQDGR